MKKKPNDSLHTGLDDLSKKVDKVSNKLFKIAATLALIAALLVFCLVQVFAIFPVITLVHTAWAGLALGVIAGGVVYFFASTPMDVADTASWALWLAKIVVRMTRDSGGKEAGEPVEADDGKAVLLSAANCKLAGEVDKVQALGVEIAFKFKSRNFRGFAAFADFADSTLAGEELVGQWLEFYVTEVSPADSSMPKLSVVGRYKRNKDYDPLIGC